MAANTGMGKPSLMTDHQNLSFRATARGLTKCTHPSMWKHLDLSLSRSACIR